MPTAVSDGSLTARGGAGDAAAATVAATAAPTAATAAEPPLAGAPETGVMV